MTRGPLPEGPWSSQGRSLMRSLSGLPSIPQLNGPSWLCIHRVLGVAWTCPFPSLQPQNPITKRRTESFLKGRPTTIGFRSPSSLHYAASHWACLEPMPKRQLPRKPDTGFVPSPSGHKRQSTLSLPSGSWSVPAGRLVIFTHVPWLSGDQGRQFRASPLWAPGTWHRINDQVSDGDDSEHVSGAPHRLALC